MQGFTPWDLSLLKHVYHRHDIGKKGYLDVSDVSTLCQKAFAAPMMQAEVERVFHEMDTNGDQHISFEELMTFLAEKPHIVKELRRRASYLAGTASLSAGATIGILAVLKVKMALLLGTLFYDPIRLFRASYVSYTAALEKICSQKGVASVASMGMLQVMLAHARLGGNAILTFYWLMYAMSLDMAVGVSMFLGYAYSRKWLVNTPLFGMAPFAVEGVAGFCGGAVCGIVERPAQLIASTDVWKRGLKFSSIKSRELIRTSAVWFGILRQAVSHSAFFSAFHCAKLGGTQFLFEWKCGPQYEVTSWKEALVTASSGCCAGGSYRLVSVPMSNIYAAKKIAAVSIVNRNTTLRDLVRRKGFVRMACKGLGESLAWTMPATGFAFLVYEAAFVYF